jgi:hypothetical protein
MSIDIDTPVYFTAPDGARYRVTVSYNSDSDSPRTWSNVTTMHTFGTDYTSPDGERCQDRRHRQIHPLIPAEYVEGHWVDMRRATRWVNLFGASAGILAIAGLDRGHDGTLSIDTSGTGETNGYIVITAESWAEMMGDTLMDVELVGKIEQQEVDVYNKWAAGEFTMFLIEREMNWQAVDADGNVTDEDRTMTTWETVEAVGGFDDEDDAMEQAVEMLPEGAEREN